jgi:hypothetical protein
MRRRSAFLSKSASIWSGPGPALQVPRDLRARPRPSLERPRAGRETASDRRRRVARHFHSDACFDDDGRRPAHIFLPGSGSRAQPADLTRGHTIRSRREQPICMMTRSHDRLPECAADCRGSRRHVEKPDRGVRVHVKSIDFEYAHRGPWHDGCVCSPCFEIRRISLTTRELVLVSVRMDRLGSQSARIYGPPS